MTIDAQFICVYCGQIITTTVDLSAGRKQDYVEDCQVCCRPNRLQVEIDPDTLEATIESEEEG